VGLLRFLLGEPVTGGTPSPLIKLRTTFHLSKPCGRRHRSALSTVTFPSLTPWPLAVGELDEHDKIPTCRLIHEPGCYDAPAS
jgi:hypothetical protein